MAVCQSSETATPVVSGALQMLQGADADEGDPLRHAEHLAFRIGECSSASTWMRRDTLEYLYKSPCDTRCEAHLVLNCPVCGWPQHGPFLAGVPAGGKASLQQQAWSAAGDQALSIYIFVCCWHAIPSSLKPNKLSGSCPCEQTYRLLLF